MRTKQAQGILDKAPEGATHYMKKEGFTSQYGFDKGKRSNIFDTRDRNGCVFSDKWEAISLDGLRKKHGKTVVDAVNALRGEWGYPKHHFLLFEHGEWSLTYNETVKYHICTIEEFNQCIDDLSKFANRLIAIPCKEMDYTQHKLDNPVVLKRMKVEYVRVTDSIFHLGPDLIAGELYSQRCNDEWAVVTDEHLFARLFDNQMLYRKVETEIKTEKRWVVVNVKNNSVVCVLYSAPPEAEPGGFQQIEITVEV